MNNKKLIRGAIFLTIITSVTGYIYYKATKKTEKKLFKTERLHRRNITQVINATGKLEAKGTINIGSLINGIVEQLYVEEDQQVKQGQLLAKIDDGKGDTVVKQAAGQVAQAKANLDYQKESYARQKKLYKDGHISIDEFQKAQQSLDSSIASFATQKAYHEQALLEFNNKKITSPIDGVVIRKNVSLREGVANFSPPTILYTLAEDIRKMKVELEIDETDIGKVKVGQKAKLTCDTYPHRATYGTISEISSAPIDDGSTVAYKAIIKVDNKDLSLKPGMTVHARIVVGCKKNILSIPGYLFSINKKLLRVVAKKKNYAYKPLDTKTKKAFKAKMKNKENPIKRVWAFQDGAFVQKLIEIGITDNAFFEIVSGLDGTEEIVIDVAEPDAMEKMYKQLFGGGLGQKK